MTPPRDDLAGVYDFIAELALARRALQRHLADLTLCGRKIAHPRRPSDPGENYVYLHSARRT